MPSKKKPTPKKSPAKATVSRRSSGQAVMTPVPDANRNKNVIRILIFAVVVVAIVEAMNLFHGGDVVKDYKVQSLIRVVGEEKPCGHFTAWGVAPIGKNDFVVTDQENSRLLVFDREGNFIRSIGKKGTGPKEFQEPSGLTSDNNGNAYVMDTWNGAIKGFNEKGDLVLTVDLTKFKNFYGPRGVGFDGKNFIVPDTGNHRVALISLDGNLVVSWGQSGKGPGEYKGPLAAASDGKGTYYVADTDNNRLQILDQDGKVIKIIKYEAAVTAVAVDKEGRVYVANNSDNGCVKVYTTKGNYLGDLRDEKGSGDPFRGVRWMSISADDTLMLTVGTTASLFKLPA